MNSIRKVYFKMANWFIFFLTALFNIELDKCLDSQCMVLPYFVWVALDCGFVFMATLLVVYAEVSISVFYQPIEIIWGIRWIQNVFLESPLRCFFGGVLVLMILTLLEPLQDFFLWNFILQNFILHFHQNNHWPRRLSCKIVP